jgi:xanthine dehydrogenase YagR molybdenum-binding subunit
MDELAEKLGLDPVELRIRNEPPSIPRTAGRSPMRQLVRCLKEGAQLFGWDRRPADSRPGARRPLAGGHGHGRPPSAATSCCRPSAASRWTPTA